MARGHHCCGIQCPTPTPWSFGTSLGARHCLRRPPRGSGVDEGPRQRKVGAPDLRRRPHRDDERRRSRLGGRGRRRDRGAFRAGRGPASWREPRPDGGAVSRGHAPAARRSSSPLDDAELLRVVEDKVTRSSPHEIAQFSTTSADAQRPGIGPGRGLDRGATRTAGSPSTTYARASCVAVQSPTRSDVVDPLAEPSLVSVQAQRTGAPRRDLRISGGQGSPSPQPRRTPRPSSASIVLENGAICDVEPLPEEGAAPRTVDVPDEGERAAGGCTQQSVAGAWP